MSEFIDECRREWHRLGVPDPVANEMAADLAADLTEAEAEGGTPEDVLGTSAFDPRRFAASWATARGVTAPPAPVGPPRRTTLGVALAAVAGVLALGAALALVAFRSSSVAVSARALVVAPQGFHRIIRYGPGTLLSGPRFGGVAYPLAAALVVAGIVGLVLAGLIYWSPWSGDGRRARRRGGPPRPSWN